MEESCLRQISLRIRDGNKLCLVNFFFCIAVVNVFMLFSGVQDKTNEIANLNQQLGILGLKVVPVTADGNCFFRYR